MPRTPDPTYYPARELDGYPTPVAPLNLDRLASAVTGGTARIRVALSIDEHGVVKDIAVVEDEPASRLKEQLRTVLAATLFLPASKEGRAVRSRILLSFTFGAEKPEP